MRYFFDTEFIEGFKKPFKFLPTIGRFNKPYHSIQLISIGIVAEDGREYYAISNEFNPKDANKWVKENVLDKLPTRYFNGLNATSAKQWKSNHQIRQEIKQFFGYKPEFTDYGSDEFTTDRNIEVYAYYADYDWVVLCSLFGTMMDLPHGFPMYCIDLKQILDEKSASQWNSVEGKECTENRLTLFKNREGYPKQENEHDALDDAKWNKKLYEFLIKIKPTHVS